MTKKKEDNVEVINAFQRCQTINEALGIASRKCFANP